MLGSALGLHSVFGFYVIHIGEILFMLFAVAAAVRHKIEVPNMRWLFIALLSLTPLWFVTLNWIGKSDPVLVGLLVLSWAYPSRWRVLSAVIMIMAHREIGSLMCLSLFFLEDRKDFNLLVGLLLGNAFHFLYQYGVLDTVPVSRLEWMEHHVASYLTPFVYTPTLYIGCTFSWYWVLLCLNRPERKELVVIAGAFILSLLNEDFTRDFALASLPAVLFHLERVVRKPENEALGKLAPLSVLQYQIAFKGKVFMEGYTLLLWLMGR
jgi:hypothetical protein